jgi:hypothetical protein
MALPASRRVGIAAAVGVLATASPTLAQLVQTRVVTTGPVRLDDAFVTASYACISFTNLDRRTATALDVTVRFTRPNGQLQQFTYTRVGSFATGVSILGPARGDTHTSPGKLANCASIDAPDDALGIDIAIALVRFDDGSVWTPPPGPTATATPLPVATDVPTLATPPEKPRPF